MNEIIGDATKTLKDEPEYHRAAKTFLVYGKTGHERLSESHELRQGDSTKDLMGTDEFLWDGNEWHTKS